MIMMPMAPTIRHSFHITTQEFGFLVSSYALSAFVSAILATLWVDRYDRKKALMFLYFGFVAGTLSSSFSSSFSFFLISRIITGFFGGVAGAVILSIVGDVIPYERRAQGMGILMSGFAAASVIGIPTAIYFSENYSWQAPFILIGVMGFFVSIGIMLNIPSLTAHLVKGSKNKFLHFYTETFKDKNQLSALLLSFCVVSAHFAIIPFISDYLINNLGFNMKSQIIWMYVTGGILSTFNSPLIGKFADKYGKVRVFIILNFFAMIPLYFMSNFNSSSLWQLLIIMALFFVFSGGRMIPSQALVTAAVLPQHRGGFMSLNSAVQQLSVGLTTLVGGLIIVNDEQGKLENYPIVGLIGIIFSVFAILVSLKVKPIPSDVKVKFD
jgi:predicted MFS family arabinose efflux permease